MLQKKLFGTDDVRSQGNEITVIQRVNHDADLGALRRFNVTKSARKTYRNDECADLHVNLTDTWIYKHNYFDYFHGFCCIQLNCAVQFFPSVPRVER